MSLVEKCVIIKYPTAPFYLPDETILSIVPALKLVSLKRAFIKLTSSSVEKSMSAPVSKR